MAVTEWKANEICKTYSGDMTLYIKKYPLGKGKLDWLQRDTRVHEIHSY